MKNDKGLYFGCKLLRKLHFKTKKMCNLGRLLGVKKHLTSFLRHSRSSYLHKVKRTQSVEKHVFPRCREIENWLRWVVWNSKHILMRIYAFGCPVLLFVSGLPFVKYHVSPCMVKPIIHFYVTSKVRFLAVDMTIWHNKYLLKS